MPSYRKPTCAKVHECVWMTLHDAYNFSEGLRKAFPRIRFVPQYFGDKFIDYPGWKAAIADAERAGERAPTRLDFTRDPDGELPDYFPSLGDVLETTFCVWDEPPGWQPRWRRSKASGGLYLANLPRRHFYFARGGFDCPDVRRTAPLEGNPEPNTHGLANPPFPLDAKEAIYLRGERMMASWAKGDESTRRFVHKVWRILDKMATNRLVAVDRRTREPVPPDGSAETEPYVRAARGALAWARARRHNYLSWSGRLFKPAGYFDKTTAATSTKYRR
jgi:hypothetical protein